MTRRRFTEHDVIETLWHQGVTVPCYRCREVILPVITHRGEAPTKYEFDFEREHLHELALAGADIPMNCRYSHSLCHKTVTNGTKATSAGSSKNRIAKARRSPEKFRVAPRACGAKRVKSGKIKSRGFRKCPT